MRIGITGATGFIGKHLITLATGRGHEIVAYSRRSGSAVSQAAETLVQAGLDASMLPEPERPLDVLIHLAGEPVLGFWTAAKKARIHDSRVPFTRQMAAHLATWKQPPATFICASGVGYYGDRGDEVLEESSAAGKGFLAEVCVGWEESARQAQTAFGARVVSLRTGLVLGADGGALPLMKRVFSLGIGGKLGSGAQWMPWIHIQDEVGLILWAAENPAVSGPLNLSAPTPVTNAEFTRALARQVRLPAFLPAPAFAMRLLLPGMADEMLLASQRALPQASLSGGYAFQYTDLGTALAHLLASG